MLKINLSVIFQREEGVYGENNESDWCVFFLYTWKITNSIHFESEEDIGDIVF